MDDRRKHGWAFWLTLALIALPVLYIASFGPACWWFHGDINVGGVHSPAAAPGEPEAVGLQAVFVLGAIPPAASRQPQVGTVVNSGERLVPVPQPQSIE